MAMETEMKSAAKADGAAPVAADAPSSTPLRPTTIVVTAPLPRRRVRPMVAPEPERPQRVEVQTLRHDPDAIRRGFETGDYPYKTKVTEAHYLERMLPLQAELLKAQNWVKEAGEKYRGAVRGARRRRQGRDDQALHGAPQPPRGARRGAGETKRARAHPMVFPALHPEPAGRRRNGVLRPLLVQPRRGRARHGLLQAQRISRVHAPVPRTRADAGAVGDQALQILVLRDPRGAAPPFRRARDRSA